MNLRHFNGNDGRESIEFKLQTVSILISLCYNIHVFKANTIDLCSYCHWKKINRLCFLLFEWVFFWQHCQNIGMVFHYFLGSWAIMSKIRCLWSAQNDAIDVSNLEYWHKTFALIATQLFQTDVSFRHNFQIISLWQLAMHTKQEKTICPFILPSYWNRWKDVSNRQMKANKINSHRRQWLTGRKISMNALYVFIIAAAFLNFADNLFVNILRTELVHRLVFLFLRIFVNNELDKKKTFF